MLYCDIIKQLLHVSCAQIQGIGPTFKMTVNLQNTSLSMPSLDLFITFQYDDKLYRLQKTLIHVS